MQVFLHNHPKICIFVANFKNKNMYKQICPKTIPSCFKVAGVYCISFGEHSYIGSSRNVQQRISQHRKKLRAGKHQSKFQSYYALFGEDKMYISLLEQCEPIQLKSREKYWIDSVEPDINHDGIHDTNPQKIILNGNGSRKVYQYNMDGTFISEFPSVKEASRYLGVDSRCIGLCASDVYKQYKSAYGYRWSYKKLDCLPEYINNSNKAVNRQIIVFDAITGEEKVFESVADAVRYYEPDAKNFDSSCASLSSCANNSGYYLNRYLAKNSFDDIYVLISRNLQIYNSVTKKCYSDTKAAAHDTGLSVYTVKKLCKEEDNNEWLYINQCARVKLRESGKLFR